MDTKVLHRRLNWILGILTAVCVYMILTGSCKESGTRQLAKPKAKLETVEVQ